MFEVELSESLYDFVSRDEFSLICEREENYFTEKDLIKEVEELGY